MTTISDAKTSSNTHTIHFKSNERISIISSTLKANTHDKLGEYFKKVFPLAHKHGFSQELKLDIKKVTHGDYIPNTFVGLYKWTSVANEQAFAKEPQWPELKSMRPLIWDELKIATTTLTHPLSLTFHQSKSYQVGMVWLSKEYPESFTTFREKERSILAQLGARYLALIPGEKFESLAQLPIAPDYTFIIEWPNDAVREKYYTTTEFKQAVPHFKKGVAHFESIITQPSERAE